MAILHHVRALQYQNTAANSDKIWAIAIIEDDTGEMQQVVLWGRRGQPLKLQVHSTRMVSSDTCDYNAYWRAREKWKEGYRPVTWNDPSLGILPAVYKAYRNIILNVRESSVGSSAIYS